MLHFGYSVKKKGNTWKAESQFSLSNIPLSFAVLRPVRKAILIGAGPGGLATAIRLAAAGWQVEVFESSPTPGGKLAEKWMGKFRFDLGPSLFTLPENVDELFRIAGENPREHFQYRSLEEVCHYFWEDGTRFTSVADAEELTTRLHASFQEPKSAVHRYLKQSSITYDLTAPLFLHHPMPTGKRWFSIDVWRALLRLHLLPLTGTLHGLNKKRFQHPKTVQIFDRYATYNGSDPHRAPAMMMLIPHLEHGRGAYLPHGGMFSITQSLHALAVRKGVVFHFGKTVERIIHQTGKTTGIVADGQSHFAQVVVSNMDVHPTYRKLLADLPAPERTLAQEKSSSAIIFYWGIKKEFSHLGLHNIFFSEKYREEFHSIFKEGKIGDDPTVYVNITSKYEKQDAPEGCENWFVMINAPRNTGQDWKRMVDEARERILTKLERILQTEIRSLIEVEDILDPVLIEQRTSSFGGSLYGNASNTAFAAFLRHRNRSHQLTGLYFCGGSVHPGGGIPLALFSGKIVADLVADDVR